MAGKGSILVVDDDRAMTATLSEILGVAGYDVTTANSGDEALGVVRQQCPELVISDLRMSGMHGHQLQVEIKRLCPAVPIIIITAFGSIEAAVESMRRGAFDFVTKPFTNSQLTMVVARALEDLELRREVQRLRSELARSYGLEKILAVSPSMIELLATVRQIADSTANVLITGESGTGKDLIARALHFQSRRAEAPFVPLNCAAIPDNLLESELFGYVRGAFTDARQSKLGLFQSAHRGTLFFDEIGEMPIGLQSKLLTVIESKRVRPIGATTETTVDVRVVAATNADLEKAITEGRFRADLYYRISTIVLHLPPLRDRSEDIPILLRHFVAQAAAENGRRAPVVSPDALGRMLEYAWPGNIRELQNVIQRAVILCRDNQITPADLPTKVSGKDSSRFSPTENFERRPTLDELERDYIRSVLASVEGNKSEAATILGIDRKTLYRKLEQSDN